MITEKQLIDKGYKSYRVPCSSQSAPPVWRRKVRANRPYNLEVHLKGPEDPEVTAVFLDPMDDLGLPRVSFANCTDLDKAEQFFANLANEFAEAADDTGEWVRQPVPAEACTQ